MLKVCCALFTFFFAVSLCSASPPDSSELSGILKKNMKDLSPYRIELDGASGSMNLRGEILDKVGEGTRIWVKGKIQSQLFKPTVGKGEMSPFFVHWDIFMAVDEYTTITAPFQIPENTVSEPIFPLPAKESPASVPQEPANAPKAKSQ